MPTEFELKAMETETPAWSEVAKERKTTAKNKGYC